MSYEAILEKALTDSIDKREALILLRKSQDYSRLMDLFKVASRIRDNEVGRVYKIEGFISPITKCTTKPPCRFCRRSTGRDFEPLTTSELELGIKLLAETGLKRVEIGGGTVWSGAGEIVIKAVEICRRIAPHILIRINVGPSLSFNDLVKLKELGVYEVSSNFETMNPQVFKKVKPGDSLESRIKLAKAIDEVGLKLSTTIMVGIGSSYEDYIEHIFWLKENIRNLSRVSITILRPIKGTPMENHPMGSIIEALKLGAVARMVLRKIDLSFGGIANDIRLLPLRVMAGDNREVHLSVMVTKRRWDKPVLSPSEVVVKNINGLWYYNALPLLTRTLKELGMIPETEL